MSARLPAVVLCESNTRPILSPFCSFLHISPYYGRDDCLGPDLELHLTLALARSQGPPGRNERLAAPAGARPYPRQPPLRARIRAIFATAALPYHRQPRQPRPSARFPSPATQSRFVNSWRTPRCRHPSHPPWGQMLRTRTQGRSLVEEGHVQLRPNQDRNAAAAAAVDREDFGRGAASRRPTGLPWSFWSRCACRRSSLAAFACSARVARFKARRLARERRVTGVISFSSPAPGTPGTPRPGTLNIPLELMLAPPLTCFELAFWSSRGNARFGEQLLVFFPAPLLMLPESFGVVGLACFCQTFRSFPPLSSVGVRRILKIPDPFCATQTDRTMLLVIEVGIGVEGRCRPRGNAKGRGQRGVGLGRGDGLKSGAGGLHLKCSTGSVTIAFSVRLWLPGRRPNVRFLYIIVGGTTDQCPTRE